MSTSRRVENLIRAKYPILYIVSYEEARVERMLGEIATKLNRQLHVWSLTRGLQPPVPNAKSSSLPGELEALAQCLEAPDKAILFLRDFHHFLRDHRVLRLLRDIARRFRSQSKTLILIAPTLQFHPDLEKDISVIDFPLPDLEEIEQALDRVIAAVEGREGVDVTLTPQQKESIVKGAQGLTLDEIESVLARSIVEHKRFEVNVLLDEKKQSVRKSGHLEYYPAAEAMSDVGGMENLKDWLDHRKRSFTEEARAFGLPLPKGILLLGVPGSGKSLISKAIASSWQLPMLRLDVGRIFGSLVGQSEENMRNAIKMAEAIAPCVLWIDELEKGFSGVGSQNDSGVATRVFGTFLTWMQEKTAAVFIIATANNVSALPPELLRKGRFDEIFFVDLPNAKERENIFSIHLAKRKRDPKKFKLKALAEASEGFNGAEIEQAVVGALHRAFNAERELTQKDLLTEIEAAVPLSVTMAETIQMMRDWAETRARPASQN